MDTKILIFIFLLNANYIFAYLQCQEMSSYSDQTSSGACTFSNLSEAHFSENSFYRSNSRDAVQMLQINGKFVDIPRDMFNRFPLISALNLSYCGLEDIRKTSFQGSSTHLTNLDMSHCEFRKLFQQMFSFVSGLLDLNMSHGAIEEIHETAFDGLAKLVHLDLGYNSIKVVPEKAITELKSLQFLNLVNNQITVFNVEILGENLLWLNLGYNQIAEMNFNSHRKMDFISIAHNNISQFDTKFLEVEGLRVDGNQIRNLHLGSTNKFVNASSNLIEGLTCNEALQIEELFIANNSLSSLNCIDKAMKMRNLDLGFNNIGKLNHSSFAYLTELLQLKLDHSNINNFVLGVLSHQDKLKVLDLSYNKLGNIPVEILIAAKDLKELLIDGNEMTDIPYQRISEVFPSLEILGIGDNLLTCTTLGEIFAYFNQRKTNVVAASSNKVINTANIKGIGCLDSDPIKIVKDGSDFSLITRSVQVVQKVIQSLQANLTDVSARLSHLSSVVEHEMVEKTTELPEIWTDSKRMYQTQQREMAILRAQMSAAVQAELKSNETPGDVMIIKNLLIVLITLAITFMAYKGYGTLKRLIHARGFNDDSQRTLSTNLEMNNK